jgi:hypothetical protein
MAAAAASLTLALPAAAAVFEDVTVTNTYGSGFGPNVTITPAKGGTSEQIYSGSDAGGRSELGIDYTGSAEKGGFYFLHDNYCVGACATFSKTVITFDLTNDGPTDVDLRFDSLITPGHLARIVGDPSSVGGFVFTVEQITGRDTSTLYSASGNVNDEGLSLDTGGITFNDLHSVYYTDNDETILAEVLDWGATNLNLPLATLAAGGTTRIVYTASYGVTLGTPCADVLDCSGLQVVFGDPRNSGVVTQRSALRAAAVVADPVIGGDYDPYFVPYSFVPIDTPLPGAPPATGPIQYGPLYRPRVGAVPEPATWMLMIGGFALAGGALRRRRRTAVTARA